MTERRTAGASAPGTGVGYGPTHRMSSLPYRSPSRSTTPQVRFVVKSTNNPTHGSRQASARQSTTPGPGIGPNRTTAGNVGILAGARGMTNIAPKRSQSVGPTPQHQVVSEKKPSQVSRGENPRQKHPPIIAGYENQRCKECGYWGHWSIHKVCPTDEHTTQRLYATYPIELDPPETVDEPDWEAEAETAGDESDDNRKEAEDFFARAASLEDVFQYQGEGERIHQEGNTGREEQLVRVAEGDNDYHSSYYRLDAEQYNALFSVVEVGEEDDSLENNVEYSGIWFGAVNTHDEPSQESTKHSLQYTLIRPV